MATALKSINEGAYDASNTASLDVSEFAHIINKSVITQLPPNLNLKGSNFTRYMLKDLHDDIFSIVFDYMGDEESAIMRKLHGFSSIFLKRAMKLKTNDLLTALINDAPEILDANSFNMLKKIPKKYETRTLSELYYLSCYFSRIAMQDFLIGYLNVTYPDALIKAASCTKFNALFSGLKVFEKFVIQEKNKFVIRKYVAAFDDVAYKRPVTGSTNSIHTYTNWIKTFYLHNPEFIDTTLKTYSKNIVLLYDIATITERWDLVLDYDGPQIMAFNSDAVCDHVYAFGELLPEFLEICKKPFVKLTSNAYRMLETLKVPHVRTMQQKKMRVCNAAIDALETVLGIEQGNKAFAFNFNCASTYPRFVDLQKNAIQTRSRMYLNTDIECMLLLRDWIKAGTMKTPSEYTEHAYTVIQNISQRVRLKINFEQDMNEIRIYPCCNNSFYDSYLRLANAVMLQNKQLLFEELVCYTQSNHGRYMRIIERQFDTPKLQWYVDRLGELLRQTWLFDEDKMELATNCLNALKNPRIYVPNHIRMLAYTHRSTKRQNLAPLF